MQLPKLVLSFTTLCIRHSFPNASILSCIWLSLSQSPSFSPFLSVLMRLPLLKSHLDTRHSLAAQPLYLYAPGPLRICNERGRLPLSFYHFFLFVCRLTVHGCTDTDAGTDAGTDAEATGAYKYTPSTFLTHVGASLVLVRFLTE